MSCVNLERHYFSLCARLNHSLKYLVVACQIVLYINGCKQTLVKGELHSETAQLSVPTERAFLHVGELC